jgi:hypothetical protein
MRKFNSKDFGMNSRKIARRLEGEGYTCQCTGCGYVWLKNGIVVFDGNGLNYAQSAYNAWNETSTPKKK